MIQLQYGFAPAYNIYGNVLMGMGRPDEALEALQREIQLGTAAGSQFESLNFVGLTASGHGVSAFPM